MKKIAFFVEGQTELIFINKLLLEIAGRKNIGIKLFQLRGGKKSPTQSIFIPSSQIPPFNPNYEALIYDCGSDEKVKSDILDQMPSLAAHGYTEIIGIRDLYPLPLNKLARLKRGMQYVNPSYLPLPILYEIIIAVHEVETWFLAECSHFECIDTKLTNSFVTSKVGYNPCAADVILFPKPVEKLREIYQLVGKGYNKKKDNVERTVNCLDYENIYLHLRHKIAALNELITKNDNFLT